MQATRNKMEETGLVIVVVYYVKMEVNLVVQKHRLITILRVNGDKINKDFTAVFSDSMVVGNIWDMGNHFMQVDDKLTHIRKVVVAIEMVDLR